MNLTRTALGVCLGLFICGQLKAGKPVNSIERAWASTKVQQKVASFLLPILAVDEKKTCYGPEAKEADLPKCMHALWGPLTALADERIADKSFEGDIALIYLLDFYTWDFRFTFYEEVVKRGPRMLPLLEYAAGHRMCTVKGACVDEADRKKELEDLSREISEKLSK